MKRFGIDKERDLKVERALTASSCIEFMAGLGITFYNVLNITGNIKPLEVIAGVAFGTSLISMISSAKIGDKIEYTHYSDANLNSYGSIEEHGDSIKIKFK